MTQHAMRCPCCNCSTLSKRGVFEICPVCYWEDDGQDEADADQIRGGPNDDLSLAQARVNYKTLGASHPRHLAQVRAPRPDEV